MSCFHGYALAAGLEQSFAIDASAVTFGPGVLAETGPLAASLGVKRVAVFTDARLAQLPHVAVIEAALRRAGVDFARFDDVHVEPTDATFAAAAAFARDGRFDGYISVGGGSVIDSCKAAALYATYPAPLETYVNAPLGLGRGVPGPLPPHIACPTTAGTGSECTGIAIFDWVSRHAKTGIASRRLRPTHALVDPETTRTLPANVVAAGGFDVLSHAIESYTARPYTLRSPPASPSLRPMSQGRNPWSDLGAMQALTSCGRWLTRAVADANDVEARHGMAWAATLAGIAFGNAGVHLPHAMSYAVAGMAHDRGYRCAGYPDGEAFVPHGLSVIVNAPSVFRATAASAPERHLECAAAIGADIRGASPADAGAILGEQLQALMRATGAPNGIGGVGYDARDLPALARGAFAQRRLVDNAPAPVDEAQLTALFAGALRYW
ncbi:MAG TPA: hydroxyacid-oxoacid transhydrogenase [Polyangia bacterium]|jgi:alcohol dehydrogenase class IV|nr:hydroxyacid-oxoacid transhydrogenase [Polyangia bacterium]